MSSPSNRYQEEFQDKAAVRHENDRTLLARLPAIQQGEAIEVLAPFAKAYLGLFLDMDNSIAAEDRIAILANHDLAQAIWQGMLAVLHRTDHPNAEQIAASLFDATPLDRGYVMLAGMQYLLAHTPEQLLQLPEATLMAAICFYYANKTAIETTWIDTVLIHHLSAASATLTQFWLYLIRHDMDYLPGLETILLAAPHRALASQVMLPVLQHWTQCRKKILRELLLVARQCVDRAALLAQCEQALQTWNPNEPARYALWLASAYLLAPPRHAAYLADYLGRSRERMLPLLDFVVLALLQDAERQKPISATTLTGLLQSIAPKFTPQEDRYGNLCDNSQRVMYLFYRLAICRDPQLVQAIDRLAQIRVMKLYAAILEDIRQLALAGGTTPSFEAFVKDLQLRGRIKAKCNWSDRR